MDKTKGSMSRPAVNQYPTILDEFETLAEVLRGRSIARYGDGEFNLVRGGNCVSQVHNKRISEELRQILVEPHPNCLVGIPNMSEVGPKARNWRKYIPNYVPHLSPKVKYGSSFITRPDSAPWINTQRFFDDIESLWRGKTVTMVYGSNRSLSADFPALHSAKKIQPINCSYRDAYEHVDVLEQEILRYDCDAVLLMCGPTATCLANRLAGKKHAIDLGHIGMFWRLYRNPKFLSKVEPAK
jgi:hypothetical protein